ncbi:signal peptidase II [Candidatus Parcubacteria bacterium]|jgi:signal peptidase II|nr:signal peptidase II [Candidatus Parcubacteria bacterium]MBT7228028.1 signal peptidase II [Candidatus Parcubacteria bacterium]
MTKYFANLIILFIVDRLSKFFIIKYKPSYWDGFIDLHINRDIAFSIPMSGMVLYPLLVIIFIVLIYLWLQSLRKKDFFVWPLGLLIIGAVSNVLDRIYYGGVIDFINVRFFSVFNLSDIYISIAVVWLLLLQFRKKENPVE